MLNKEQTVYIGFDYSPFNNPTPLISGKGLDYNGSFTRGFSVGNAQSLVLNSNFNLKLAGDLGNGLNIVAAISDDNIPIQAEGNTQLLQEFDQVYIRLSKDKTSVIAGDYQQRSQNSYFVNYFKKLKGASATHTQALGKKSELSSRGSFAIAKGKFNRYNLPTIEGNQGPYKLIGANGERFLIVLSGSERVYLDGSLLKRGESHDYVLDYNRAEISFTPNRLITREARIVVEYEYTDQNYLRTIYTAESSYTSEKLNISAQIYSEQDSKNGSGQIDLDSLDRAILMQSGDDPKRTVRSGISPLNEQESSVTYALIDNTATPDPTDTYLEYSTDSTAQLYRATFSEVGVGNGDYSIKEDVGINGRVYEYVGPGNGSYLPIIQLIAPELRQVFSSRIEYKLHKNTEMYGELSISRNDRNRLSDLDDNDNQGTAAQIGFQHSINIDSTLTNKIAIHSNLEHVGQRYNQLNPFRSPEFTRDWSLPIIKDATTENIWRSGIDAKYNHLTLSYLLSKYDRQNQYSGNRHKASLTYRDSLWLASAIISYTQSEGFGNKSKFLRPTLELKRKVNKWSNWELLYKYENEKNSIKNQSLDLSDNSFEFRQHSFGIINETSNAVHIGVNAKLREDFLPSVKDLNKAIDTKELNGNITWQIDKKNNIQWTMGIRNFEVTAPSLTDQTSQNTLLSRISSRVEPWKGVVKIAANYDISSGQEPKQEFVYEKVEKGQGEYIYIGSGNVSEGDELYLYEYRPDIDTANYIKVFLYNNEFIRTNNQTLKLSLRLNPKKIKTKNKHWWQKISSNHTARIVKKVETDGTQSISLFSLTPNEDNVAAYRAAINNTLFFNRSSTKYDIQIGHKFTENRLAQISGSEQRNRSEYFTRLRWNIRSGIDLVGNTSKGIKKYNSIVFALRNHIIDYYNLGPEINFRPNNSMRFVVKYLYDSRKQTISNQEQATSHDLSLEGTYRSSKKLSYNTNISYVNVNYLGEANTAIEYDLLDGLKNGNNFIWNATLTRRMANNVDLNIQYNGRKTGIARTVHVARAQIKATF